MKLRYFFSAMVCYLLIFAVLFMIAELIFMIRETIPSIRLLIMIVIFALDIVITRKVINGSMAKWMRYDYSIYSPKHNEVLKDETVARDIEKKELREAKKDLRERQKKAREEERAEKRIEREKAEEKKKKAVVKKTAEKKQVLQKHEQKPAPKPSSVFKPQELGQDLSDDEINRVLQKLVDEGTLESADQKKENQK